MYTKKTNDGNMNRTINLLISSNVHYIYLGRDKKQTNVSIPKWKTNIWK